MINVTNFNFIQNHFTQENEENQPKWLQYLSHAEEIHQNYENVESIYELKPNAVLDYVHRTLSLLEQEREGIPEEMYWRLSMVLAYSEVAKGGTRQQRKQWIKTGYNLMAHNEGSADIFSTEYMGYDKPLLYQLIKTHGLIGQYIRGESRLKENEELVKMLKEYYDEEQGKKLLYLLNYCIIAGVSTNVWNSVKKEVESIIQRLFDGNFESNFEERVQRLTSSCKESAEEKRKLMKSDRSMVEKALNKADLWYVEPSMHDLSFEDFWTILSLVSKQVGQMNIRHINFEKLMQQLHYDYKDKKHNNVYRKRVIEKYLQEYRTNGNPDATNVVFRVELLPAFQTAYVSFEFSGVGEALINFCVESEKVGGAVHNRANVLLFDLFGLRRDAYDRFNNEEEYLKDMNSSSDDKRVILEYIKGEKIVDVGPGGGVLLDMIEEETENKKIIGIDISENVIEALQKKKKEENREWEVVKGDALNLSETFGHESLDTIVYSSIIHELFSYIPYEGEKFNHKTIQAALVSAYNVLKKGGRIIIRDGIMTEQKEENRIIRFKDQKGMAFLELYAKEFRNGEVIRYEVLSENEVKIPVNHAMEFLYTYTWGEEAYAHEVNEQFGYFTPKEYVSFVEEIFGGTMKIIEFNHYLQEGYPLNLLDKIDFEDEQGKEVSLPDSTCLLVLEKR